MTAPIALEPLSFPLHGSRLIEASAGTGKTWTIAALYLRLVLGHGVADARSGLGPASAGSPTAFGRPLIPAEILVMTFTRAATRELSHRIRSRLIEAAQFFRGEELPKPPDEFLVALRSDYPEGGFRQQAAWRLATAAEAMDDASIMTIDAWCQRMLNEHAFDTGNPFDETLLAQDGPLLEEAIRDYWRQHVYPLEGEPLEAVCSVWKDAEAFGKSLKPLLRHTLDWPDDPRTLSECAQQLIDIQRATLARLSEGWAERAQAIRDWYQAEVVPKANPWNRARLKASTIQRWTDQLEAWALRPLSGDIGLGKTGLERLTPEGIRSCYKGDPSSLRLPAVFEEFAALADALAELEGLGSGLRAHAAARIVERLQILKRDSRSFSFADMTGRLERALAGPSGERLRTRVIAQYPVALIDEFQDTSPAQYRLFDALYRCADNDPDTALILIGDPKQSIYAFRGADIHSYLKARAACAGRIHALAVNHRSTPAMVRAVNAWFEQADRRLDPDALAQGTDGAFRFRSSTDDPMPFLSVRAKGRNDRFCDRSGPIPALTIQYDLNLMSAQRSRSLFASRCAVRIVDWINDGSVGFDDRDKGFQRLRPADIAVLVRDRHEASAVRRALRLRGVASIFQSEQESVFASVEAADLLRWLRAVAAPGDMPLVRAALATRTLDLPFDQLVAIAQDDDAYDAQAGSLRELQGVWRSRGVLAMLRRALHVFRCPARWLAAPDGERRLTNLLHLAELLQQASVEVEDELALIQWLARRIDEAGDMASEEQVLRLESDADLVQIITIHKSKGLEYPVVFLPFACSYRPIDANRKPEFVAFVDASGERQLRLDYDSADLERADLDRLREDLRLFYVALTRARHAVWMGFASLKRGNAKECLTRHSAPGRLLAGPRPVAGGQWLTALEALVEQCETARGGSDSVAYPVAGAGASDASDASEYSGSADVLDASGNAGPLDASHAGPSIVLQAAPLDSPTVMLARPVVQPPLAASPGYTGGFEREWTMDSYSSLTRYLSGSALAPTRMWRPAEDESEDEALAGGNGVTDNRRAPGIDAHGDEGAPRVADFAPATPQARRAAWHSFPGGMRAGDFVHGVLERLAAEQFDLAGKPWLEEALKERCQRAGHAGHEQELIDWMRALVETPLPSLGATLQELRSRVSEMEFWMPATLLHARAVDRLCRDHLLEGCERPELPPRTLNGMLMGFADLVFEHQGRYWVLDYKTNRPRSGEGRGGVSGDQVYDRVALRVEMARHRHDVQAAVYLLALHRQLRARLGRAYDPRHHLGGAIYWFIRGIDGPVRGEYAIAADDGVIELLEQLDRGLGGGRG